MLPSQYFQGFFLSKLQQHKFFAGDVMANFLTYHLKIDLNFTTSKLKSYSVYNRGKKMYEAIHGKINLQIVSLDDYTVYCI